MRSAVLCLAFLCVCTACNSQTPNPDEALLAKARALYDAPFTRGLISFDCAVHFDWKQHFVDTLGTFPPAAAPAVQLLQAIPHRVFVDRSGAVVSAIPTARDLSGTPHASDLEKTFDAMIAGGLSEWVPFSTNVILPAGSTKSKFEKIDTGYRLTMSGPGVAAELLLSPDLRLLSADVKQPPLRFTSEFSAGPDGYLLDSVMTGDPATFTYKYRAVDGFQLPSQVSVKPAVPEVWRFGLEDCKVMKGVVLRVSPPPAEGHR